ncbi:O-acyltransferase WSD1-like [Ananas comosus]|uniref:O-acyltransferase WSD1-like n=1 Tax=Ananas comosus TaxID=4615 RepID=A0A6P5EJQ8_ANACO|nr:O-acyltransferase WSD1-like [Ananas comosus]
MAWHTLVDPALFAATAAFLADSPTPLKAPPLPPGDSRGVGRRRKRFVHRTTSFDDVKRVKNAMGCTVNNVLVGVTSAGLSRYLSRKFDDGKKREKLLANLRVRSTLLVNVRSTVGIHDLAEMMKRAKDGPKWGNWIVRHLEGYVVNIAEK